MIKQKCIEFKHSGPPIKLNIILILTYTFLNISMTYT